MPKAWQFMKGPVIGKLGVPQTQISQKQWDSFFHETFQTLKIPQPQTVGQWPTKLICHWMFAERFSW